MALVARSADVSFDDSTTQFAPQVSGELYAGEDLDAGAPCYIAAADGKVYMSDGTAANEAANVKGFVPRQTNNGEPATLFGHGARLKYSDGNLSPGDSFYLAATPGRLDDAATTGGTAVIAWAVDANDIVIGKPLNP